MSGVARRVQVGLGFGRSPGVGAVRVPSVPRRPLLSGAPGEQRRDGARLDQVDGTTCGSAVLVALAAWADPTETERLDDPSAGFGACFDARQREIHRETNRLWPRALGTTPWAMARWLRRRLPAAGPYRVRLVDDRSDGDVAAVLAEVARALDVGRPVPLLVGPLVPRHYVMALTRHGDGAWRVYEPASGSVRVLDTALVGRQALRPVLGFDRLHAVLLPS